MNRREKRTGAPRPSKWFGAILAAVSLSFAAAAQDVDTRPPDISLRGIVLRNLAPFSTDLPRTQLPTPLERRLSNGLRTLIIENHRIPKVDLDLTIEASPLSDPEGRAGVAEAVCNLLKHGTREHDAHEIARRLSELGATLNATTQYGYQATHITLSVPAWRLDPALKLLSEILLSPVFPAVDLEEWKRARLGAVERARGTPFSLAQARLRQVLYSGDPRAVVSPSADSLGRITRQDLLDFYAAHYRPLTSLLGITGDFSGIVVASAVEKYFDHWPAGATDLPKLPLHGAIAERRIYVVDRPGSVQTYLLLGNRALDRLSSDYVPSVVMSRILGGGPASRVFRTLREEKGYAYSINSGFTALKYLNYFYAFGSVRTEVTAEAVEALLTEFRNMREQDVSAQELLAAKRAIVSSFLLELETQRSVLGFLMERFEQGLPADYWDLYPRQILAVTAEDVRRIAFKYVPVDNVQIVAVGDARRISGALRKFGAITEYTVDGNLIRATPAHEQRQQ
jgi:zinc protease